MFLHDELTWACRIWDINLDQKNNVRGLMAYYCIAVEYILVEIPGQISSSNNPKGGGGVRTGKYY